MGLDPLSVVAGALVVRTLYLLNVVLILDWQKDDSDNGGNDRLQGTHDWYALMTALCNKEICQNIKREASRDILSTFPNNLQNEHLERLTQRVSNLWGIKRPSKSYFSLLLGTTTMSDNSDALRNWLQQVRFCPRPEPNTYS